MARRLLSVAILLALCAPAALDAQWWDAQLPRRGELQIGLTGQNTSVDHRFAADGTLQPLSDVFGAQLDARLVPQLDSLDAVLAGVFPSLGLSIPGASTLGNLRYDVLLERTYAPISLNFGATDWLSVFAVLPIVKGKSFVTAQLDSLSANAGDGSTAFGDAPDQLFQQLNAGIGELEAMVAADTLAADMQARAEQLVADARAYEAGMTQLRQQQYVPSESGTAGQELTAYYQDLRSGFLEFAVDLPLVPLASVLTADEAIALSSGPGFGIQPPQDRSTGIKFGDIEAGLSFQPFNTFRHRPDGSRPFVPVRFRVDALYRLATGSPPKPDQVTDVGVGDGQPDVEFRGTLDIGFGSRLWLSLFGGYNLQLQADVDRLITTRVAPIQLGAYVATVAWNPGDVLTLMAAPRFNFTRTLTFSGLFMYLHHGQDRVEPVDPVDPAASFTLAGLEQGTRYTARSFGFAARYSTTDWAGDRRAGIPVEVELSYLHTTSARDGLAPQRDIWRIGLRYYQRIFR